MFPYPSGDLHMGHAEAFSGGDAVARFKALSGFNVMHPIGWDAFGLNAENAAIKRGIHPKEWTYANIEQQAASFKRMGMSFDWARRVRTCDPEYYRWTQWLFLKLFERGLAYRKTAPVNWCPKDQTVLANEQVIAGACERCGTMVERRDLTQWFFKITDYAQRLLDDMETLDEWPERVLTMQRNWIGRSEGAEVTFTIEETGDEVRIFTTRPDTLWGVTFFVFALEHPLVERLARLGGTWEAVRPLIDEVRNTPLTYREEADTKDGVALGVHAVNPVNGEKVPCFVAPYVLMQYGTGAIMAVPGHDERDFAFARQHGLPVKVVIQPDGAPLDGDTMAEAYAGEGVIVHSGPFDGERTPASIHRVAEWLEEEGRGQAGRHVPAARLADQPPALLGRAHPHRALPGVRRGPGPRGRASGAAARRRRFPARGRVAVGAPPLVVTRGLPELRRRGPPRHRHHGHLRRLLLVLLPVLLAGCDDAAFRREDVDRWMPVGQYTGGVEHAILHLLYSRFFTKVLYDIGMVGFTEPFPRMMNQGQVIYDGASMSKTKGNIVEPMPIVERWGADSMRLIMLFAGPFEDDIDWKLIAGDPDKRPGVHSWLGRVFAAVGEAVEREGADEPAALVKLTDVTVKGVTEDLERFRFNTAISKLQVLTNEMRKTLDAGGRRARAPRGR